MTELSSQSTSEVNVSEQRLSCTGRNNTLSTNNILIASKTLIADQSSSRISNMETIFPTDDITRFSSSSATSTGNESENTSISTTLTINAEKSTLTGDTASILPGVDLASAGSSTNMNTHAVASTSYDCYFSISEILYEGVSQFHF